MQDNDFQFYPSTKVLANKAWAKFKNRSFTRILESSAGEGHLAKSYPHYRDYGNANPVDCIELDLSKHAVLRAANFEVVGLDFMSFTHGDIYSHIIMNPPFAYGAQHALHAWKIMFDGEIVAILNAETIRNPFSRERQELVALIEQYGDVEYFTEAFSGKDAERKTEVEVALVYLRKDSQYQSTILDDLFKGLRVDGTNEDMLAGEFKEHQEIAISNSVIENAVLTFNVAVEATKQSVFSEAKANHYASILGDTMAVRNGDLSSAYDLGESSLKYVQESLRKRYEMLKDRAWSGILRSSNVTSHLSSNAQRKIESEFATIKKLDFTVSNIYGFLLGLVESKGDIQKEMVCEVFDKIVQYHSENTVFYMGWKSNDKHRSGGMRVKTTRFIIPNQGGYKWSSSADYRTIQFLSDFDKVFAMLDGKSKPEISLADTFNQHYSSLKSGDRLSTSYFDVRYYPGIGTIHFFPRSKQLMDKLNRFVGRMRDWLPPEGAKVSDAFWLQYTNADKFDKELRQEVKKTYRNSWNNPMDDVVYKARGNYEAAMKSVTDSLSTVLERNGINLTNMIEQQATQLLLN